MTTGQESAFDPVIDVLDIRLMAFVLKNRTKSPTRECTSDDNLEPSIMKLPKGNLMSRRIPPKRYSPLFTVMALGLLCLFASGCNYLVVFGYLIGGPPSVEPLFETETKESMSSKDVKVCVVCFAPNEIKYNFENIDNEVAQYVSHRLHTHKIVVIQPDLVKGWLEENKDWDRPEEIGNHFKTDYVISIDLNEFSLYEEGSAELYRGRAEAIVSVWKMDGEDHAERIFTKEKISKYPLHMAVDSAEKSYQVFKGEYLSRLSEEIGRFFYEYETVDEIGSSGG